jgi:hypothetical protein
MAIGLNTSFTFLRQKSASFRSVGYMNNKKRRNLIRKHDYCRVLVTETLPYETPIIFSNDGLYERISRIDASGKVERELLEALVFSKHKSKQMHSCVPYLYKVRKNSLEYRRLALIHHASQWKIKEFYQHYESVIIYCCSHSQVSIRSPERVAGSFYFKNASENLNKYKNGGVCVLSLDELTKHSPSFFSYRGFERLYKFFESKDYLRLERRFSYSLTLDVSKCFDSVYTHTLSWAVKDKAFTKSNVGNDATFAQAFDAVIRHANHNETNGIVIGPEVSRIFAEIIFQEIDRRAIAKCAKRGYGHDKDYCLRRYVDDVFIFAANESIARQIYGFYSDVLVEFNLHANSAKSVGMSRPFVTAKSRLIQSANVEVNNFIGKFLKEGAGPEILIPERIHSRWRLTRSFFDSIKSLCSLNKVNYDEISSYLISVLGERIKKLVAVSVLDGDEVTERLYGDAILVMLDVLFFLYGVSPSVNSSYKMCTSIILLARFVREYLPNIEDSIAHSVHQHVQQLLAEHDGGGAEGIDGFLPLEVLNVLLATQELGQQYLMSEDSVAELFSNGENDSYFSIVSCLFYIADAPEYQELKKAIVESASKKLADLRDLLANSEKSHLLLDLLACPYIDTKQKSAWVKQAYLAFGLPAPSKVDVASFLGGLQGQYFHVDWKQVDLLSALEKKELKQAY